MEKIGDWNTECISNWIIAGIGEWITFAAIFTAI